MLDPVALGSSQPTTQSAFKQHHPVTATNALKKKQREPEESCAKYRAKIMEVTVDSAFSAIDELYDLEGRSFIE